MKKEIANEAEMKAFGLRIASLLKGGEVLELIGDVGAGKTTLAKGIGAGLEIEEDIQSPSFTISRTYTTPHDLLLVHYDFYRLNDPGIMASELSETINDPQTVTLIEWADIVSGVLPDDRLSLLIVPTSETARRITLTAGGERSKMLQEALV